MPSGGWSGRDRPRGPSPLTSSRPRAAAYAGESAELLIGRFECALMTRPTMGTKNNCVQDAAYPAISEAVR